MDSETALRKLEELQIEANRYESASGFFPFINRHGNILGEIYFNFPEHKERVALLGENYRRRDYVKFIMGDPNAIFMLGSLQAHAKEVK